MKTPRRDEEIERDFARELGFLRRLKHPRAPDHLLSALNSRIEEELRTSDATQKKGSRRFSLGDWFILPHVRTATVRLATATVVIVLLGLTWFLLIKPTADTEMAREQGDPLQPPAHSPGDSTKADSETIVHEDLKKPLPGGEFRIAMDRELALQYDRIVARSNALAKEGLPLSLGIAGAEPRTLGQCIDAIRDLPSEESVEILYVYFGKGLAFDTGSAVLHEATADRLAQRRNFTEAAALYSVARKRGSRTAGQALERILDTLKNERDIVP